MSVTNPAKFGEGLLVTSAPPLRQPIRECGTIQVILKGEEIFHGQVSPITENEERIKPQHQSTAKYTASVQSRNLGPRPVREAPFLPRFEAQYYQLQYKSHSDEGSDCIVIAQQPLRPDTNKVHKTREEEVVLDDQTRAQDSIVLKRGETGEGKC